MRRPATRLLAAVLATGAVVGAAVAAPQAALAAKKPIVVWADEAAVSSLQAAFPSGFAGRSIVVVGKPAGTLLTDLAAATDATAPDVIQIEHTSVGALAASSAIVPISVEPKVAKRFATGVWSGFTPAGITYGIPVTVANVALLTNATLVPTQPTTFEALATTAMTLKKAHKVKLPFAIGQAPAGDAEAMYPLFSGLGGYVFSSDASGTVNTGDLGLANPAFLANTGQIDGWNATKLLRSEVTAERARTSFVQGRTPFWIGRVSDLATIMGLSFPYRITAVPTIVAGRDTSPMLTMSGFAETTWAEKHHVAEEAAGLLAQGLTGKKVQAAVAAAVKLPPASSAAQAALEATGEAARLKAFGAAGAKGVAAPSVPQREQILAALGNAWLVSTSGDAALPAKKAFKQAQQAAVAAMQPQ